MIKKIKKPVSILLSLIMVFSLFTIVPFSASAAVGDVLSESEYLTFTAVEAGSSVTLKYANGTLKYNINNSGWQSYTAGTQITLADVGDYVRFSGTGTTFNSGNHVSLTGAVACSGNVMSLRLDDDGKVQGLAAYCFDSMFYKCTSLTQAPELPETELKNYCYINMFYNCTSLTKAPELPATNLAESCYRNMFSGCTSLTKAPELPATNLANSCYSNMFYNCTSLTKAPELPATELVDSCYYRMFYGCTSLTKAPELPATNLANSCYSYMFSGCKSLTKAPELPATNLAESCYNNMFYGCESLTELPALPATTLANRCYYYMFSRCSSLTELPALPATTLTPYCYYGMFYNCSNIRISTTQDTTYSVPYRIPTTGTGTTESNALYNMFYNTGGKFTGTPDINTTYYVPAPETFKVFVKKLTDETYTIENLTGETTVAQLKEIIANQIDIPATAQRLVFGGKQLDDAKTLAEYNIEEESTIHLVIRGYTVTWLNYDNSELGTTTVQYGATPSYDGETPTKPEDANNTYTFSGWTPAVAPVTGDVTYTAQFDETPKQHQHDGITFDKWTSDNSLPTEAGNYVLTSDVTLSGTWTVPAGETNLCLAGYTIRQSGSGSVIQLNNANEKLTVYDDGTTGTITGGNTNGNGGGVNITAGTFTLKGGNIEGNVASNGAGVSVNGSSSYFTMTGGTIRYNAGYIHTGGVLLMNTNNFTMTGGEIRYNVGKNFGGIGISIAEPNMSGKAVVKDNVIFNDISASNTKITKNDSGYTLASGGTPCDIKDATVNGLKINVIGAFESGAQIGIFNNNQTAEFTSGFDANNPGGAPADYFFSNDSNRFIMRDANKEAQLGGYFTVTWKGADGTVLETDENVVTGTTPEFNGTIPEKPEDDEATYTATWSPDIAPVTGDVTYTLYYRPTTKRLYKIYIQCTAYNWLNMTVDKTSLWSTFNGSPIYNGTGYSLHHIQITSGADVMTVSGNMITVKKQGTASFRGFVNGSQYLNFNLTVTPYYTVTWENYDGTELQTGLVLGGATPVYTGAEPEKETADGNAYYPFLGWSPEVETATADTTYTAVFSDTAVPYQHTHDGIKFKEWTNTDSLPKYASNYCLTSDVTTSATWTVPAGEMNLCLNGHKIDANGGNYAVITIGNGRTLNLYDPESGGVITGANHTAEAGGVMVSNGGHFNMYGGSIEGNRSNNGGGVSANGSNAVFHMYGGSIQYNEGYDNTGGILLQSNTTFTMSGGSIQHNAGKNYGGIGTYQATMIFDGDVNISDNYIYSGGTSGKIAKSGDTYTLDTTGGTPCNVKTAHANDRIKVTGQLTLTHKIGIIRQGTKGVFTTGYTTSGNTADPSEYFYSDDPNYTVGLSNGEAAIVDQYTVTWNNWDNSNLETDTRVAVGATPSYGGETPTKAEDAQYTYTFAGWKNGETTYAPDALPAVTGDTEYTATFDAVAKNYFPFAYLSLNGDIGVNFGIDTYGYDPEELRVNVSWYKYSNEYYFAGEDALPTREIGDKTYFIATANVAAKEMADTITVRLYKGDTELAAKTYSVRDYALTIINAKNPGAIDLALSEAKFAALKDLCKALLKYGSASEAQFDPQYPANIEAHTVDGIVISASDGVSYEDYNEAEIPAYTVPDYSVFAEGLTYYGSSIGTKTTTNYLIAFVGSNAPSVRYNGKTINPVAFGEGGVAYNLNGIAAKNIPDDIVLTVNGNDVRFNMLAYITKALNVGDETLQSSVRALYDYGVKAKAYFNMAS